MQNADEGLLNSFPEKVQRRCRDAWNETWGISRLRPEISSTMMMTRSSTVGCPPHSFSPPSAILSDSAIRRFSVTHPISCNDVPLDFKEVCIIKRIQGRNFLVDFDTDETRQVPAVEKHQD
ncbi:unnamed protein product [Clavelina lepadiformis]|uniref:Uncharacterized protein n=1 Tax=Clavelina lepadiformis TaxID=159417 RepID=A0ABP0GJ44_CLALP